MQYTEDKIEIKAIVRRWRHMKQLDRFVVESAPPHVICHITGKEFWTLDVIAELSQYGYPVSITTEFVDVSLAEAVEFSGNFTLQPSEQRS